MSITFSRSLVALVIAVLLTAALGGCSTKGPSASGSSGNPNPIVESAVEFAGAETGAITGYVIDLRLETETGPAVLELIVADGAIYSWNRLSPMGAWETTPAVRAGRETGAERDQRERAVKAAREAALSRPRARIRAIADSQVYGYIVACKAASGMDTRVFVRPDGSQPATLAPLEKWPPS